MIPHAGAGRMLPDIVTDLKARGSDAVMDEKFARDIEEGIRAERQPWTPHSGISPPRRAAFFAVTIDSMPSLTNEQDRNAIGERMSRLTAGSKPKLGKMNSAQMLWHLAVSPQTALGEKKSARGGPGFLKWGPVRNLIIYHVPLPKGAPTAPERVAPSGMEFDKARAEYGQAAGKFARHTGDFEPNSLPGAISREDWGTLMYRRTDHLRQLGL